MLVYSYQQNIDTSIIGLTPPRAQVHGNEFRAHLLPAIPIAIHATIETHLLYHAYSINTVVLTATTAALALLAPRIYRF